MECTNSNRRYDGWNDGQWSEYLNGYVSEPDEHSTNSYLYYYAIESIVWLECDVYINGNGKRDAIDYSDDIDKL